MSSDSNTSKQQNRARYFELVPSTTETETCTCYGRELKETSDTPKPDLDQLVRSLIELWEPVRETNVNTKVNSPTPSSRRSNYSPSSLPSVYREDKRVTPSRLRKVELQESEPKREPVRRTSPPSEVHRRGSDSELEEGEITDSSRGTSPNPPTTTTKTNPTTTTEREPSTLELVIDTQPRSQEVTTPVNLFQGSVGSVSNVSGGDFTRHSSDPTEELVDFSESELIEEPRSFVRVPTQTEPQPELSKELTRPTKRGPDTILDESFTNVSGTHSPPRKVRRTSLPLLYQEEPSSELPAPSLPPKYHKEPSTEPSAPTLPLEYQIQPLPEPLVSSLPPKPAASPHIEDPASEVDLIELSSSSDCEFVSVTYLLD